MASANGTNKYPRIPRPEPDSTHPGEFVDEDTEPGADIVITNATLHKLMMKMNSRLSWLAAGVFFTAGSVVLMAILMWWSRPK